MFGIQLTITMHTIRIMTSSRSLIWLILFCFLTGIAAGIQYRYIGEDGIWQTPTNWSPTGVPGKLDNVIFNSTSQVYVSLSDMQIDVNTVVLRGRVHLLNGSLVVHEKFLFRQGSMSDMVVTLIGPSIISPLLDPSGLTITRSQIVVRGSLVLESTSQLALTNSTQTNEVDSTVTFNWSASLLALSNSVFVNRGRVVFNGTNVNGVQLSDLGPWYQFYNDGDMTLQSLDVGLTVNSTAQYFTLLNSSQLNIAISQPTHVSQDDVVTFDPFAAHHHVLFYGGQVSELTMAGDLHVSFAQSPQSSDFFPMFVKFKTCAGEFKTITAEGLNEQLLLVPLTVSHPDGTVTYGLKVCDNNDLYCQTGSVFEPLHAVVWVVVGISFIFGIVPLALTCQFRSQLGKLSNDPPPTPYGPVGVIVPCKGIDQGFHENIRAVLAQSYHSLHIVFVTATAEDPARAELLSLVEEHCLVRPSAHVTVAIAGIENKRAQKLTNQLHGLSQLGPEIEYLVFLDSDIRPDPEFVERLVAPLDMPGVGATTGFRWYHPPTAALGGMLRSAWNAGALPLVTNPRTVFAFGGAMAAKRAVFERAGVAAAWDGALSDDFPFTFNIKALGLTVCFVPSCVAISFETSTVAETIEFTNRQSTISRVYFPSLWWSAALTHSVANLFLLVGLAGVIWWAITQSTFGAVLIGALVIVPLQWLNALALLGPVQSLFPTIARDIRRRGVAYMFCAPLASIMSLINTIASASTRQITWRGIRYELVSPTETRVLGGV